VFAGDYLVMRAVRVVLDLLALFAALAIAFALRFDGVLPPRFAHQLSVIWPWAVGLEYACLLLFQVPRTSWRFFSLREAGLTLLATLTSSVILVVLRFATAPFTWEWPELGSFALPLGVIAINAALVLIATMGIRAVRRMEFENRHARSRARSRAPEPVKTIIIGAGSAGHLLVREAARRPQLGVEIVGFVDDDPRKLGTSIHGVRVLGVSDELADIGRRTGAEQALIAIAAAGGQQVQRLTKLCEDAGLPAKIIPPVHDIVSGRVNITQIRDVAIEDLLGRDPIVVDELEPARLVRDKVVVVTGAGGSIGSELCRQIVGARPRTLILIERAENNLFHIHRELDAMDVGVELVPAIADVCDEARVREVFEHHRPEIVFHAAAHKHVPMMELNPGEAVKNNAHGTRVVADLADALGVATFILISSDKAVHPTSVMGATKRLAELYLQALQCESSTRFVSVRFGNVLGSAGSVIPLFREQIARGGPVTVTHPAMVRYFMTIPEACQLVLEAAGIGEPGAVMVLDMGEPVRILDLAEQMIRLSGLEPGTDIEIEITGIRPGEKLYEELCFDHEALLTTRCPKVFLRRTVATQHVTRRDLDMALAEAVRNPARVRDVLRRVVESYAPERSQARKRSPA